MAGGRERTQKLLFPGHLLCARPGTARGHRGLFQPSAPAPYHTNAQTGKRRHCVVERLTQGRPRGQCWGGDWRPGRLDTRALGPLQAQLHVWPSSGTNIHAPSASRPAEVGTTQGAPRVDAARRQSSAMLCPWTARHLVSAALLWRTTTAGTWRHSTAYKALCNHRSLRTDVTTRRVGGGSSSSSIVQVRMRNPKGK